MLILLLAAALSASLVTPSLACGVANKGLASVPRPGAGIDAYLPESTLTPDERSKVKALRARVAKLAVAGRKEPGYAAEEEAMQIMGYTKMWMRCGPGTFTWIKL
jgi:hypothetical protein